MTVRTLVVAAFWRIRRPVPVEPVKYRPSKPACFVNRSPRPLPRPVTTFRTPGGNPHSAHISANLSSVSGASLDGLTTTEFPAASAGAMVRLPIHKGPFHGTMWPVTPTGSRRV
jgi:hypothetical protein